MAATLDNLKIGTTSATPTDPVGTKDAVHTAIILVRAECALKSGDTVFIDANGNATLAARGTGIAAVDPFVTRVQKGHYFWAFLRPSIMEGIKLRHEFKNPPALAHLNVPVSEESAPVPKKLNESQVAEALGFEMRTGPLDPDDENTCTQCEEEIVAGKPYFTKGGYPIFCSLDCIVYPVDDGCRGCY